METFESDIIQMELKYCERCGGLWLRLTGSELVYCPSCAVILAGVARDPRFLQQRPKGAADDSGWANTFWGEGGNA